METFYDLGIERKKNEALIQSVLEYDEQKIRKAELTPQEPFEMEISEGKTLFDIVGYQDTSNFAISKRLYDLLKENEITGWKGYEISIKGKDEIYYGFQVTGKCGKLDMPAEAGFYTGYKFDHGSWDGSDFFSPDETMLLFCTEKVQTLLKKQNVTNAELANINTVQAYSVGNL